MIRQKQILRTVCFFVVFLILGTSNHCAFEDLFASIAKSVFGVNTPHHLMNHYGSSSKHRHNDASESHEHGQPHTLLVLNMEKIVVDFVKLTIWLVPLALLSALALRFSLSERTSFSVLTFVMEDPPGFLQSFIYSLTLAPQAPPAFA